MSFPDNFKIYCLDEKSYIYVYVDPDDPNPVTCPNNINHTIDPNRVINLVNRFNKYDAVLAPVASNDIREGYNIGSNWIDTNDDKSYICLDPTKNTAIWKETTPNVGVFTTDDVTEGVTNLYFTNLRVNTNIDVAASTIHRSRTDNPHNVTKAQVGLANVANLKVNLFGTVSPSAINDSSQGYNVGSRWIDIVNDEEYVCVDDFFLAAVWKKTSATTTDDIAEDSNLYYTEARVDANSNVSLNTTHRDRTDNPHSVTKSQVGLSEVQNLKIKLDATSPPATTNDSSEGYSIGSRWLDINNQKEYICIDNSVGAAVWKVIGGDITSSNVGTSGIGFFKQKNGDILEFKNINLGSNKLSLVDDVGNNEIDIDLVEGNVNINNLNGAPSSTVVGITDTQTLTNKTIDADQNTVINIADAEIKSGAGINADKIADGSISNTEFQHLDGVTSSVVGINDTQILNNKTLVDPQIQNSLKDINGNEFVKISATGSAVNEITLANAAIGNAPEISATGDDTNIDLKFNPKGSGNLILDDLSFPNTDGSANQVMKTDGAGNLSFANVDITTINMLTTINNVLTTIDTIATANNVTYFIETTIIGRRVDSGAESASYLIKNLIRNDGGVLTKVAYDRLVLTDNKLWNGMLVFSGTNILIQVKGENAKTINWKSSYKIVSVN